MLPLGLSNAELDSLTSELPIAQSLLCHLTVLLNFESIELVEYVLGLTLSAVKLHQETEISRCLDGCLFERSESQHTVHPSNLVVMIAFRYQLLDSDVSRFPISIRRLCLLQHDQRLRLRSVMVCEYWFR